MLENLNITNNMDLEKLLIQMVKLMKDFGKGGISKLYFIQIWKRKKDLVKWRLILRIMVK